MKPNLILLLILLAVIASCGSQQNAEKEENTIREETPEASVSSEPFGTLADGTAVEQFTLSNSNGITMKVITYGGIITSLSVPDKDGNFEDIVLGFDNLDQYVEMNPYFGAIIGRYGNRIAGGKFSLDGEEYSLATNDNTNHLHGGEIGFDKVVWAAEPFTEGESVGLHLTYESPDMQEGYPGALDVTVTYTLDNDNRLIFDYSASTDKPTIVNLTNHSYFNLSGMKRDITDQVLTINADSFLPVNESLIPTEPAIVSGTPFDFTEPRVVGADINADDLQIANGGGYDHCWILNQTGEVPGFAASLYDPQSGRLMEVYTTEPGVQFYSGNFLDGSAVGKNGVAYERRSGLCLETQHFPDSPNRPDFPSTVLRPGEVYRSQTISVFSVK